VQISPYTPDNAVSIPISFPSVLGTLEYITSFIAGCPNVYRRSGAPTVDDDVSEGYKIGDMWVDIVGSNVYIVAVVTDGAALWRGPL